MKNLTHAFFVLMILSIEMFAQADGFKSAKEFTAVPVEGYMRLTCYGQGIGQAPQTVSLICQDVVLDPVEMDYFVADRVDADQVNLVSHRSDGKEVKKSSDFQNGSSTKRFNLWISTLTQKPFLRIGLNTIDFELTKNGQSIKRGSFQVPVKSSATKYCPDGFYTSYNENDCMNDAIMCSRYFKDFNYCQ